MCESLVDVCGVALRAAAIYLRFVFSFQVCFDAGVGLAKSEPGRWRDRRKYGRGITWAAVVAFWWGWGWAGLVVTEGGGLWCR